MASLRSKVIRRAPPNAIGFSCGAAAAGRTGGHTERRTHLTVDVAAATTEPQPIRSGAAGPPTGGRRQTPPGGRADSYNPVLERAAKLGAAARTRQLRIPSPAGNRLRRTPAMLVAPPPAPIGYLDPAPLGVWATFDEAYTVPKSSASSARANVTGLSCAAAVGYHVARSRTRQEAGADGSSAAAAAPSRC